jgi:hypothetical protein
MFPMFFAFTPCKVRAAAITVDGTGVRSLLLAISGPPVPVDSRVMLAILLA